ncbi:hypothetical protein H8957_017673, partial [Semnopithecus entellus]
ESSVAVGASLRRRAQQPATFHPTGACLPGQAGATSDKPFGLLTPTRCLLC